MKSNVQTLSSASHRISVAAAWLNADNSLLSELLESRVSNLAFVAVIAAAVLAFCSFIFALDANAAYGWSAFCALAAVNCAIVLFREFNRGGE